MVADPVALRILVVDDPVYSATSLGEMLELWGCQVCVAYDGAAALIAAREFAFDMILLDIGMPGVNGFEVARRLRAEHGHGPMLVAMTGYGQAQDRQESQAAGFDHYLVKPVDWDRLRELLTSMANIKG